MEDEMFNEIIEGLVFLKNSIPFYPPSPISSPVTWRRKRLRYIILQGIREAKREEGGGEDQERVSTNEASNILNGGKVGSATKKKKNKKVDSDLVAVEKSKRSGLNNYLPKGHLSINNGSLLIAPVAASNSQAGTEMLRSMLAATPPPQQKQILGEHLFPLVQSLEPDLAAKLTRMLLEMDNSELLLLLEWFESLSAMVDEAVHMLKHSKTKIGDGSGQDHHPNNILLGDNSMS